MYLQSLVLLLCILYGSVFVFGKLALTYAPPFFLTGSRMMLAGVILLAYQFVFNRSKFTLKKEQIGPIIVIAVSGVYLTNVLEFWGLQYMESAKACFLYSLSPIMMAILSYVWFYEKITPQKWLGLSVGIMGFIPLLILPASSTEDSSGRWLFFSFAELALIGATVANAVNWLAMRENIKIRKASPMMTNGISMILGGSLALSHSYIVEPWAPIPVKDFWPFLQWFLILMVISNLISYNLHAMLLRTFTATYLSFAGLSQPFFAAVLGWLFLNEVLSPYFWFSLATVTLGLYLYYQAELRRSEPVEVPIAPEINNEVD